MNSNIKRQKIKEPCKSLGKSEARRQFLPMVNSIAQGVGPIEITDYGKVVAVLLSRADFDWLQAHTLNRSKPIRKLCGLGQLLGGLEEGSREISKSLQSSLQKTAAKL